MHDPASLGASGNLLLRPARARELRRRASWLPSVDVNDDTFDPGLSRNCRFCCTAGQCAALAPQTCASASTTASRSAMRRRTWSGPTTPRAAAVSATIFYDRDPELGGDLTLPRDLLSAAHTPSAATIDGSERDGLRDGDRQLRPRPGPVTSTCRKPGNCPPSTVISSIQRIWNATDQAGNSTLRAEHLDRRLRCARRSS
jgi:hypothetical protein